MEKINNIHVNCVVVIPYAGLGTGLAQLPDKAPKIYSYILQKIHDLQ